MVTKWMITASRARVCKREWKIVLQKFDIKKWIIAKEVGKNGYEHWQVRLECSGKEFFKWMHDNIPSAHVEKAELGVDECRYETKEGQYTMYSDRVPVLIQRFGGMRNNQKRALQALQATNDREVLVWYDEGGNVGKSWLTGALWERGLAYYVPPTIDSVKGMIQWVASCYKDGGYRPYIIIDIPRSWKWSEQLYVAIESIKDGMVYDTRYSSKMINIRGVKVMCLTNTMPKLDKLSQDRWRICVFRGLTGGAGRLNRNTNRRPSSPPLGGEGIDDLARCLFQSQRFLRIIEKLFTGHFSPIHMTDVSGTSNVKHWATATRKGFK